MVQRIHRWPSRWSVRGQLTVVATTIIALLLAVAAVLLVWRVNASLLDGLDDASRREALAVS